MKAPICLFTYNRLNEVLQTLEALQRNFLAPESELFIFSDGPKNEDDKHKVNAVRNHIQSVKGFKSVEIILSDENNGLASSIIHGVSQILEKYENVIVLEDDLITTPNFLNFMNEALNFYQNDTRIQSVNAYSFYLKNAKSETYFQIRTGSWGWATWKNRWNKNIFDKEYIRKIIQSNPSILSEFKKICGADVPKMLMDSIENKNDSWYIRWVFDHFYNSRYAVFPSRSFINNIGHSSDATHCKGIDSYYAVLVNNTKLDYEFSVFQQLDPELSREFLNYFSRKHKIIVRIKLLKSRSGRGELYREIKVRLGIK
jgi:Predicted glycosyltransferases